MATMNSNHGSMDLQQLRYVVAVAATASFTRAAATCFVTQSALSHRIAALEREIGQRLFVRTSRSVALTEAGEAFLTHARAAVSSADQAVEEAAAASGAIVGVLRLGVIPTVTAIDVAGALRAYRAAHPSSRVEMRMGNSDALIAAIRSRELDVAVLGLREGAVPDGVASRTLATERLQAVFSADHRLAAATSVDLADLAGELFADFPAGTAGRMQSDVAFRAAGVERDVAFEADSAELIIDLVASGLAVTLLARGVVRRSVARVAAVDARDGPARSEYLAWHATDPRSAARAFLNIASDRLA